jgi:hypothetical protein
MTTHSPRFQYDCGRCKFNWNCGPTCACALLLGGRKWPEPPEDRKKEVDAACIAVCLLPEYREATAEEIERYKNRRNILSDWR